MALIETRELCAGYDGHELISGMNFTLEKNERVCLVGRNGAGKSTMLKLFSKNLAPTEGELIISSSVNIGMLAQQVPGDINASIYKTVAEGLGSQGALLGEYHQVAHQLETKDSPELHAQLDKLTEALHASNSWSLDKQIKATLTRLNLEADLNFSSLSAGMKRRVLLAKALVSSPDVLLLDEPTNHLDIPSISWLEQFLLNSKIAIVFVTHDRNFLKKIATRIVEIDRGNVKSYPGDFEKYQARRIEEFETEEKQNFKFDKKLSEEEAWIRKGIKARGKRNMGRVRELEKMRLQRSQRKQRSGQANMQLADAQISGRRVAIAENISFEYEDGKAVFDNFSTRIFRGDRIGIVGKNGCGKTTLVQCLLGNLTPQTGSVELGENLEIAYFDQLHGKLELDKTVVDNITGGGIGEIEVNGRKKHVFGYLQDFLFSPQRAQQMVCDLSGGERNRLLLAKLFMKPSNVLVLDEPTNDLDCETLELLEECLANYAGTVITVSHDRAFLNNVVTSIIAFSDDAKIREYVGGYDDYLRQHENYIESIKQAAPAPKPVKQKPTESKPKPKTRRTYKEKIELRELPAKLEACEEEKTLLEQKLSDPDFYKQPGDAISQTTDALKEISEKLDELYARWEYLESLDE